MSRRWRSVLIVAGFVLGPIAIGTLWVQVVASRRWAETLKRTEEIERELAAPLPNRRPLRGEPLPGNAWEDYAAATDLYVASGFKEYGELENFAKRRSAAKAEIARPAVELLAPAIARLRKGVRRSSANRPTGQSLDGRLILAARAQARFALEAGRAEEAFELLADLVRAGQDDAQGFEQSLAHGYRTCFGAMEDLFSILGYALVPRERFESLARELAALEDTLPAAGRYLLLDRNRMATNDAEQKPFVMAYFFGGLSWRYGWSSRLYFSHALDQMESWARSISSLQDRPWTEVARVEAQAREEAARSGNGFMAIQVSDFKLEMYVWSLRTWLRVARASAMFRATGERIPLDDPFGGKLVWDDVGVRSRGLTDDPKDDIVLRLK